jgi:serine protease Do
MNRMKWAFVGFVLLPCALAYGAPPAPLPTLPAGDGTPQPVVQQHAASTDQVRRGIVSVEIGAKPVALGTVLGTDGRVLTALSALGASSECDVRYADNHVVHARVGHKDPSVDLALLVPQAGKWTDGLPASENDPAWVELRGMALGGGKIAPVAAKVKGRVEARAKDGSPLSNMLDVDIASPVAGAPLIDNAGAVAGVMIRACKAADAGPCAPVWVAAPVATLRSFLAKTPANAVQPAPWLGINGVPDASGPSKGVRVVAVAPQSPAEKAGLRAGADLIAAVDGQPVDRPEKMAELISKHAVGETVKLLVLSQEKFREVAVVLKSAP